MPEMKNGTWVVVTDSEKALILVNDGDAEYPNLNVWRKETQDNPPTRDQAANRPGRFNDGPSPQRSAVADTDWHELAKERFAEDLAEILNEQALKQGFERLVLVAGPKVLGNLRKALHAEVEKRIIFELDKNLAGQPMDEIERHIQDAMGNAA